MSVKLAESARDGPSRLSRATRFHSLPHTLLSILIFRVPSQTTILIPSINIFGLSGEKTWVRKGEGRGWGRAHSRESNQRAKRSFIFRMKIYGRRYERAQAVIFRSHGRFQSRECAFDRARSIRDCFFFFFFLFPFHRDKFVPRIIIIMGSKIFHAIFDTGEREEMGERRKGEIYSISGKSNETRPATILAKRPATTKSGFLSSERGPFYWRHRCFPRFRLSRVEEEEITVPSGKEGQAVLSLRNPPKTNSAIRIIRKIRLHRFKGRLKRL